MRKFLIGKVHLVSLGIVLVLLALRPSFSVAQDNVTLAVFQFRPESIEAMGYESDVMLAVRNEIGNRAAIRLIPKRAMEDVLAQKDIDQSYSIENAILAGEVLSVRFVLIGTVRKQAAQIEAEMKLVDVNSRMEIGEWHTSYRSRNEIDKAAATLVEQIVVAATQPATKPGPEPEPAPVPIPDPIVSEPLRAVVAEAIEGRIEVRWSALPGREPLGYNIYRSTSRDGPFEFLDTAEETSFSDLRPQSGVAYFYRIGEVDMDGMEHRSAMIARGMVTAAIIPTDAINSNNGFNPIEPAWPTPGSTGPEEVDEGPDYQLEPVMFEEPLESIVVEAGAAELTVRWQPAKDSIGDVQIYRSRTPFGEYAAIGIAEGLSYVDSKVETGLAYYYKVGILDSSGIVLLSEMYARGQLSASAPQNNVTAMAEDAATTTAPENNFKEPASELLDEGETSSGKLETEPESVQAGPLIELQVSDPAPSPLPSELIAAEQRLLRQAKLVWGPAAEGSGYRIYRRSAGLGWMKIAEVAGLMDTIYIDSNGLKDDSVYEYSFSIVDGDSESAKSNTVEVTTKAPLPAPVGLQAEGLVGQVKLQWQAVDDADVQGYAIYRADCSMERNFDVVHIGQTANASQTSWVDLGVPPNTLAPGTCYRYAVETLFAPDGLGPLTPAVRAETKAL